MNDFNMLRQEIEEKFDKLNIFSAPMPKDYDVHTFVVDMQEIKDFIFSTVIPMVIEKIKENVILDGCDNLCPDKLEIFLSKLKEEGLSK